MTFEEKVKFLRTLPQFKVIPISEVRAIAFVAKGRGQNEDDVLLGRTGSSALFMSRVDVGKITRVYPDLKFNLD